MLRQRIWIWLMVIFQMLDNLRHVSGRKNSGKGNQTTDEEIEARGGWPHTRVQ